MKRMNLVQRFVLSVVLLGALSGCKDDKTVLGPADACENVTCSGHGDCASLADGQAVCICDPGYHADGLDCAQDVPGSECDGVDCSGHGACVVVQAEPPYPACMCDEGYAVQGNTNCVEVSGGGLECGAGTHEEDGKCVADQPRPDSCEGVDCGDHGQCTVSEFGVVTCDCEEGYRSQDMQCVPDCTASLEEVSSLEVDADIGFYGDIQIVGNRAYVWGKKIAVVDLSDPSSPVVLGEIAMNWHGGVYGGVVKGDSVIVCGSHWLDGDDPSGWAVYDFSDPANPSRTSFVEMTRCPRKLHLDGDVVYGGTSSYDVSDLNNISVIDSIEIDPSQNYPTYSVLVSGPVLWSFFMNVPPSDVPIGGPWFSIDASDPEHLTTGRVFDSFVGSYLIGARGSVGFYTRKDQAYLWSADLSNPEAVQNLGLMAFRNEAGNVYTVDMPTDMAFFDHFALVQDQHNLYMIDVGDPANLREVARIPGGSYHVAVRDDGLAVTPGGQGRIRVVQATCN